MWGSQQMNNMAGFRRQTDQTIVPDSTYQAYMFPRHTPYITEHLNIPSTTTRVDETIPIVDTATLPQYHDQRWQTVMNTKGTKRKGEEDGCGSLNKQRITDERMAAGISSLFITTEQNCSNTNQFDLSESPNMIFSQTSERVEEGQTQENDDNSAEERNEHPVFQFNAPLEQYIKAKDDILPTEIIREIYKPCLAVIPYTPPLIENKDKQSNVTKNEDEQKSTTDQNSISSANKYHIEQSWIKGSVDNRHLDEMDFDL